MTADAGLFRQERLRGPFETTGRLMKVSMIMQRLFRPIVLLSSIVLATPVLPATADVAGPLRDLGWKETTFNDKTPNSFVVLDDDAIEVSSMRSVSLLRKSVMTHPSSARDGRRWLSAYFIQDVDAMML